MIRANRRGSLSPDEMFPAGDPAYRVSFPRLRSGTTVRAVERGDPAAPPVLLLHGWGCTVYVFRRNMPVLANAGYRAIAVDLKGHGLSQMPLSGDEYTIDALIEHVLEILDALELARIPFVGHSMSGSLIYHFATRHPERVLSLAMLSPVGLTGVPLMWLYRLLTPSWLMPSLRHVRSRLVVKVALERAYGKRAHFTQEDVEEYLAPSQFPDHARALRQLLHRYDWKAAKHRKLEEIRIPAVAVWGSLDHMMPDDGMEIYKRLIPELSLREIPDAGHIIPEETPDDVNEAIISLLRRGDGHGRYISRG